MKITLESTTRTVRLRLDGTPHEVPARIWQGATESGIPVFAFITRIAPEIPPEDDRNAEFVRDLEEQAAPRAVVEAIPLRLII